ncbi:hypothetical protein E4U43_007814 [Claviceps pusilla]|uniref:Checkpoint protein RAD24-like helical bundle domain-containing protein n=1 Tax=Claviceps pusilla TaxID=123648 RepID=A0A9P7NDW0_9HYPO|nr:hypothetical protein E4U43_007814 [Claviceps pusilla]
MAPPAKRRRRNPLEDSDDDDDDDDERPRANTLSNFLLSSPSSPSHALAPTASPSPLKARNAGPPPASNTSPTKSRRGTSQKNGASPSSRKTRDIGRVETRGRTADLKTLFSKQAQRATKPGGSSSSSSSSNNKGAEKRPSTTYDPISDPISEDDEISELKASSSSLVGQHARKRLKKSNNGVPGEVPGEPCSNGLKFLKPPKPTNSHHSVDEEFRPWSERFGPRNLDELAVHKKKVSDVRRWLDDVMTGRKRQRVLVLKGAAGSGKTTTMRLLAKDMGFELLEWKNPAVAHMGMGFVSLSAQFDEFLGRGGKFGTLDVEGSTDSSCVTRTGSKETATSRTEGVILIEEFPNTFSRSSSALTSFRSTILQYLAHLTPSLANVGRMMSYQSDPIRPVVLVVTETLLTTTSASADSLTAHRLLGPEILRHPGVGVIEFNAIAPTILAKALELVVLKEARRSGRRRTPGPQVLQRLGEIGDVRSAISSLEFLCLKGDEASDWGAKVAFTKPKKSKRDSTISLTEGESESLELISQREASLGIFHAVGKVVYNKRDETAPADDTVENLPSYLSQYARPKRSQISVDALIDETGTDTHTFISALHENYILSCESTGPMDLSTPMDYVNDCIEYLSESDLLCPSRDVFFGGGRGGFSERDSSSHTLRQDEMTFQVAVRGMLFSLPNPVRRKTSTTMAKGSDAFKMFYPTSLKLWRAREEIEGLVDLWSTKLLKGESHLATTKNMTDGATAFLIKTPSSTSGGDSMTTSWMQRQRQRQRQQQPDFNGEPKDPSDPPPLLSLGSAAQREMLLDRLPYMAHMARAHKTTSTSSFRLRDLEKVVSFTGLSDPAGEDEEDASDEDNVVPGEAWATDQPFEEASLRSKKRLGIKEGVMSGLLAQKLVLSDDDIED